MLYIDFAAVLTLFVLDRSLLFLFIPYPADISP